MANKFLLGTCYYPEHWPAARHENDFRRMKETGIDVVRMGEGAWGYFEPREGQFQFELFDRAIALCRRFGIKVIFGTPTYCGPAWIASKYPEVLRWDFQRVPMGHGSRRNFTYSSEKYLELSDRICTALTEHYAGEKQIIAWQLDNEFNCHMDVSYSPSDTIAFRKWLGKKYGTLEKLNRAWGTAFWSQQYDDWGQIDLPLPTSAPLNPSQVLDESRFISDRVVEFAGRQARILRKANPRWQITHNGLFANVDGPALVRELDFFSHDQYPLFCDDWPSRAEALVQARSLSMPFGILEQQSGPGGQMSYLQRTPKPGEVRLWAWQSVAHGANLVSFFLWRTCPIGTEQHWHGLIDQDDKPTQRLEEAKQFGAEAGKLPGEFFNAAPVKFAAVLRDFDNEINERRIDTFTKSGQGQQAMWMRVLSARHIPVDFVWPGDDFKGYRVLIVPHQQIVTESLAKKIQAYVSSGGQVVLGALTGLKDENCHIVQRTPPGLLAKLAGVEVGQWTTLGAKEARTARMRGGQELTMTTFVEQLRLRTANEVARWTGGDPLLGDAPAVAVNSVGKGSVYYIGGYPTSSAMETLLEDLLFPTKLRIPVMAPPEVEVVVRVGKENIYSVAMNHSATAQQVVFIGDSVDLLTGKKTGKQTTIPGLGVIVAASAL
jgi:beta-galactosidase